MTKRMLIDASHAEETRVAVVDGTRIEELDFEIQSRKQLRGNIYLAKVIRVEPSLQAAFVEYGGNRHGFLAFNEIHPDYFQIPVADREALMREVAEDRDEDGHEDGDEAGDDDEAMERELERRRSRLMRRYKIQEVLRRRQIMLVQVVKEERGNKGAALTTYLSLAGRYCVLMPNTARGGGISRKITNAADRKRLKSAAQSLDVPQGMGLIIRTAGAARTKVEIKRDYEYLLRMWENIRETTLKSIAPSLIYAEEDLVKRAVRDMFDKDFDSIQVAGDAGYREARDFMRMIMPSQAKKVVHYKDPTPLFVRHKVEEQLAQIHSPVVPLKSGGYLVINQTEALVAIDVNSGRATRERNIEQTAFKTNCEAAEEAARQLRLRDLAGLIVIDFIDMDEGKNNRAVEKVLKDALKDDRARVQMGKISQFGLMEISRQRRRMGVLEGATHVCEHCHGTGRVRSVESSALSALRAVEIEAVKGGAGSVILRLPSAIGLYVLNCKRAYLARLEQTHGLTVVVAIDEALAPGEQEIERTESREGGVPLDLTPPVVPAEIAAVEEPVEAEEESEDDAQAGTAEPGDEGGRGRGRRRRRRGGRDREFEAREPDAETQESDAEEDEDEYGASGDGEESDSESRRRRRRRGRRGGRRMREEDGAPADPYVWRHAHPSRELREGDDVYAWRDAHSPRGERIEQAAQHPRGVDPIAQREAELARAATQPIAGPQTAPEPGADPYFWMDEAEAAAVQTDKPAREKPRRSRGGRSRKRGEATPPAEVEGVSAPAAVEGEASAEVAGEAPAEVVAQAPAAVEAVASEPAVETPASGEASAPSEAPVAAPEVAAPALAPAAAEEAPAEAQAEPAPVAAEAEPAPMAAEAEPAPREPDPNEITAPPATPRRGWWRRSG